MNSGEGENGEVTTKEADSISGKLGTKIELFDRDAVDWTIAVPITENELTNEELPTIARDWSESEVAANCKLNDWDLDPDQILLGLNEFEF
jgi:hypothetical protein